MSRTRARSEGYDVFVYPQAVKDTRAQATKMLCGQGGSGERALPATGAALLVGAGLIILLRRAVPR